MTWNFADTKTHNNYRMSQMDKIKQALDSNQLPSGQPLTPKMREHFEKQLANYKEISEG